MRSRRQPSKYGILDAAKLLPRELAETQKKIDTVLNNSKSISKSLVESLSGRYKQEKYEYDNRRYIYSELPTAVTKEQFVQYSQTVVALEEAMDSLINLATKKMELKEDARVRKAIIRTGNVKAQIDELIPDQTLIKMAKDLETAYSKLETSSSGLAMYQVAKNQAFPWHAIVLEHMPKMDKAISQPKEKINSFWLQEIVGGCMNQRNETNQNCRLIIDREQLYDETLSKKLRAETKDLSQNEKAGAETPKNHSSTYKQKLSEITNSNETDPEQSFDLPKP